MTQEKFELNEPLEKIFKHKELEQIVKAIVSGKYSWACFLILHFSGYNPMDFIPYRTYIRLLKNNCQVGGAKLYPNEHRKLELLSARILPGSDKHGSN
ncbi:HetP family heterocyst commitment protein [Cylindrospermum sp. FACHB-282]|uniref:HetP family heterocyst commitment protein n=1 Tax=Cylindrospermum sp. FACHB-282 TaxID=2692794 RepID=UPI0016829ACE|nr:HetP family heterocyst commitment protein [Cylindrospermum sp. FACHB-282]MBD2385183.1 HetP family heterocyst commitment protein [Cylindrospermum sp. FACHB-282]